MAVHVMQVAGLAGVCNVELSALDISMVVLIPYQLLTFHLNLIIRE